MNLLVKSIFILSIVFGASHSIANACSQLEMVSLGGNDTQYEHPLNASRFISTYSMNTLSQTEFNEKVKHYIDAQVDYINCLTNLKKSTLMMAEAEDGVITIRTQYSDVNNEEEVRVALQQ